MNVSLMRLCTLVPALFLSVNALAQHVDYQTKVLGELKRLNIPGLAVAKLEAGQLAWVNYYGYQNLEQQIPVSEQTVFHVASLSKPVTAAAIMQLVGQGYCSLDDDINRYLPFAVRHPFHPQKTITLRQLLRHRSAIHDNLDYLLPFWEGSYKGPKLELEAFLKNYLTVGGSTYRKEKNFIRAAPGQTFEYSNMGYALLGYLVETITKMPYDAYCQKNLFAPLNMQQTHWFVESIDPRKLAVPYLFSDSLKRYQPQPHSTYPDYPAGQLRSSAGDLAKFLGCWINDGQFNGKSIIDSVAVQTLTPNDMSLGFHTWFMYLLNTETPMYSHQGHDVGVSTYLLYDPYAKNGLVILTNGELSSYGDWRKLIELLYQRR